jgi:hypothetical protein
VLVPALELFLHVEHDELHALHRLAIFSASATARSAFAAPSTATSSDFISVNLSAGAWDTHGLLALSADRGSIALIGINCDTRGLDRDYPQTVPSHAE